MAASTGISDRGRYESECESNKYFVARWVAEIDLYTEDR